MRASSLFLALSTVVNLALVALIMFGEPGERPVFVTPASGAPKDRPVVGHGGAAAAAMKDPAAISSGGTSWPELADPDLARVVYRLRSAGFPPRVVVAVIETLVAERFAGREEELYAGHSESPYWRQPPNPYDRPESRAAVMKVDRDQQDLLRQLLGADYMLGDENRRASLRRTWGNLPDEKLVAVMEVANATFRAREALYQPGRAVSDEARAKLLALERENRAAIEKLLTPDELAQYDLRRSPVSGMLQFSLRAFNASEAEYQSLYRILGPLEDQFRWRYREPTEDEKTARRLAEAQVQPALQAALGPERYADYLHARKPEHEMLNGLVARLGLPLAAARAVAAVQEEITTRANAVRDNASLSSAARAAGLDALATEAGNRITATLGPRGFAAYRSYGGQWLTTGLKPPEDTASPSR